MSTKIQAKQWKTKRANTNEVLIENYVTKEVQNILKPLNILQKIVLVTNYKINNNFIFPIDWKNIVLSLISVLIVLVLFSTIIYRMIFLSSLTRPPLFWKIYSLCASFNFTLFIFGHVTVFIASIKYTNCYVKLVLNFQKILNSLNFTAKSIKLYIFWNWFFCLVNFVQFVLPYFLVFVYIADFNFFKLISFLSLIVFDAGIFSSIRIAVLIKDFVKTWLCNIKNRKITKVQAGYCVKMFKVYINILSSYKMFVIVFQDLLIYWSLDTFVHALIYVEQALINSEEHVEQSIPITLILILWWTAKRVVLIAILVLQIENIHIAMEKVQAYSLQVLNTDCSEAERRMLKNILRVHRCSFSRANARGLFYLDATLPLLLASNISNYIFVLLQFSHFNGN